MMNTLEIAAKTLRRGWLWLRYEFFARRFVRHVGILTVANVVSGVLMLIQAIVVARWLGPELYGVAALAMAYPGLIFAILDARSSEASVKYLSEFHAKGERDRVLAICKLGYVVDFVVALLAFFLVFATANWAAQHVAHRHDAVWLIVAYAAALIPRGLFGTSYAVLATLGRFPLIAWIDILLTAGRVGLVLVLVWMGWEVAGVVSGNAIAAGVTGVLYGLIGWVLIYRTWGALPLQGDCQSLKGRRREIFGFLTYNDLSALLGVIPKQLDVVLLGYFRNPMEVGYYKIAKSLAGTVGYLVGPLQSVTYPELVKLWSIGDRPGLREKVRKLAVQVGLPLGLLMLVGTAFVPFVLRAMVGRAYQPATVATQLLLVGSAVWLAFFWLRPLYLAQGAIRAWTGMVIGVVFLSIAGFFAIIPTWGFWGLAIWLMLMYLVGNSAPAIYLKWKRSL